jgi:hypothetical protein
MTWWRKDGDEFREAIRERSTNPNGKYVALSCYAAKRTVGAWKKARTLAGQRCRLRM